jgi:hypothetical protein
MFDPKRLWVVDIEATGCTRWLVIADDEDDAKEAAEELEAAITFTYDARLASIRDGVLVTNTDMGSSDDVIVADSEKDEEISLHELRGVIAEWHKQQQREWAERNNGQLELIQ